MKDFNKPKKKRGGWIVLLCIVLLIAIGIGSVFAINGSAKKQMNEFMPEHPYILSGDDTRNSIRNDFALPNSIEYNEKERKIVWRADSDAVVLSVDGDVTNVVVNDSEKPQKVTLVATYKFLLIGKAEKTYEVQILPSNTIKEEDVHIVDTDAVKNKTYDENMTMVLRKDGTVASMYGDFKQKIYHSGDALVVLNAYKDELGFSKDVEFIEKEVVAADNSTYLFDMAYNGVAIANSVVYMSVNDKFELVSIKCNFDKSIKQYKDIKNKPKEQTIDILGKQLGRTAEDTVAAIAGKRYENVDGKNCLVVTYALIYSNGEVHTYDVNETTGVVIGQVDHSSYLFEGLFEVVEAGAQKIGDAISTDATGEGVNGDTKSFTASHIGPLHMLYNPRKNITAFSSTLDIPAFVRTMATNKLYEWGVYLGENTKIIVLPDLLQVIGGLDGLIYSGVETAKSLIVCDIDNNFNVPLTEPAVDSYYYLTMAYDYYNNRFDRLSYDNKGGAIRVFTNFDHQVGSQFDNACWHNVFKCFYVYPVKKFGASLASHPEVLGHEYTHAVFGSYADGDGEISGINEAYADMFGILMSHPDNWKVGDNTVNGVSCYVRDLENINSDKSIFVAVYNKPAPEKYHDAYWKAWGGEEHAISCMLGNIAYKMYSSGKFTQYEFEDIWYKSLTYGYSGDDNFVTCRQQILQAMRELNFSAEQRDFVRSLFDEKEIFDDTDIYECDPEPTPEEIAYEELMEKLKSLSTDDGEAHRFAIMVSPIGFSLNKTPLYIFEEVKKTSSEEEALINKFLNEYWGAIGGEELSNEIGEYVGQREGDAIVYKQIPSWGMDIVETIFGKTQEEITSIVTESVGSGNTEEEQEILDNLISLIFVGNVGESTRAEFFEGVME